MEFPRLVYRKDSYKLVATQEQCTEALADGWFATVPEALEERVIPQRPVVEAPPTREELEMKAKELKIKFSKVMSDPDLMALIQERLES